jgi:hypothetical protein
MASPTTSVSVTSSPTTAAVYLHDGIISAMGVSWLRGKGRDLAEAGTPWFLAVNLVNPHDVMFYDADAPGTPKCRASGACRRSSAIRSTRCTPNNGTSSCRPTTSSRINAPAGHRRTIDFLQVARLRWSREIRRRGGALAPAPQLLPELHPRRRTATSPPVLAELEASGLADRTIIVLTADHGDMDGAHKMHSKGAVAPTASRTTCP